MDCSPSGSSVHGILQATMLEWVANSSSRRSPWLRDQIQVSCLAGRFFTTEPLGKPINAFKGYQLHVGQIQNSESDFHSLPLKHWTQHFLTVRRVSAPRFFVLPQQRFGVTGIKAPLAGHSSRVLDRPCYSSWVSNGPCYKDKSVLQLSATALFYFEDSRKIHLQGMRARGSKDVKRRAPHHVRGVEREREKEHMHVWKAERVREREREREHVCMCGRERERERARPLAPHFMSFFFPRACPMQIGLGQEHCSTWSPHSGPWTFLWPSSVLFSRAVLFLVFLPLPLWTPFPYSNYLTLPTTISLQVSSTPFWLISKLHFK